MSKFNYQKSLLAGKAKTCLLGIDTTAENYKIAVDLLYERFGDAQNIIKSHMDMLLSLRQIKSHMDMLLSLRQIKSDNVSELREIYDVIEVNTRSLATFDISAKNYGPILNSIIMSKLPHTIRLDISRQMPSGQCDVAKLMNVFNRELMARERCENFETLSVADEERIDNEYIIRPLRV